MWLNHAIDTRKKKSAISEEIKNIIVVQPPFEVHGGGGGGGEEENPGIVWAQGEGCCFLNAMYIEEHPMGAKIAL